MTTDDDRRQRMIDYILARSHVDEDGCRIWDGRDSGSGRGGGYPRMDFDGGTMAVHRVWFELFKGPIPPKKQLDHQCRKRMCITCTEMVTHRINQARRAEAARAARGELLCLAPLS